MLFREKGDIKAIDLFHGKTGDKILKKKCPIFIRYSIQYIETSRES